MKKINKELIFLIIGTITLFLGVLCVCALPLYFEKAQIFLALKKISFLQYLLFFNTVCCYFASMKYYKFQINLIIFLICCYIFYYKFIN